MNSSTAAALFIPTMITMILFIPIAGKILDKFQTHYIIGFSLLVTTAHYYQSHCYKYEFYLIML